MKILISFHNKEGYENIIPVAEYLKKKDFRITINSPKFFKKSYGGNQ